MDGVQVKTPRKLMPFTSKSVLHSKSVVRAPHDGSVSVTLVAVSADIGFRAKLKERYLS